MSHKFLKGIEEVKKNGLTKVERNAIFSRIIEKTDSVIVNVLPEEISKFSWIKNLFTNRHFQPAFALVLFFFLGSSGLMFGSIKALPGNVLYPFKVGVMEPIIGSLITGEAGANYQISLATKRLVEAENLVSSGKLDAPKQLQIENLIIEHTSALKNDLEKIEVKNIRLDNSGSRSKVAKESIQSAPTVMSVTKTDDLKNTNKNDKTESIRLDFESKMNAHAKLLENISNEKSGTTSSEVLNVANQARESGRDVGKEKGDENNNDINKEINILNLNKSSESGNQDKGSPQTTELNQSLPAAVGGSAKRDFKVENKTNKEKGKKEFDNQKQSEKESGGSVNAGEKTDKGD